MRTSVASILATVLLLAATSAGAQQRPTFDETTTVVVVEVPVNVVKDNRAVRGLTAGNFAVFDRHQPVKLSGFEAVDLALPQAKTAGKRIPVAGRRRFLLLFDLSFTRPDVLDVALRAARDLVDHGLHPTDLVAVGVASASYGVEVPLGFSPDRRQVGKVLDALERLLDRDLSGLRNAPPEEADALRLLAGNFPTLVAQIGRTSGLELSPAGEAVEWGYWGGRTDAALAVPTPAAASINREQREVIRERKRSAVLNLTDTLEDLARLTAGLEGRKFLVFFSEGFDSRLLAISEGGSKVLRYLNEMVEEFRRGGWTIQSVDPGGLRHDDEDWRFHNEDSLTMIAKDTGGELYNRFNDLSAAMERMLDQTSVTYLLSFHAENVKPGGSFHPLRVELRNVPRGARVLYPPGFRTPKPPAERQALEQAMKTGELILRGTEGGELETTALVAPFKGAAPAVTVTVWVEVEGPSLLAGHSGDQLKVEIFGYALGGDHQISDFFSQQVNLDLGRNRRTLERGSLKVLSDLALPPGRYDLRVLVRTAASDHYALRVVPLAVPDLTATDLVLLPPFILDDPRRSIVVREADRSPDEAAALYPFTIGTSQFVPAVSPVLAPDQVARICLMAYHLEQEQMLLSAGIERSDGSRVESERLTMVGKSETTADGLDQLILDFDPRGLEPGEYTLRVGIADQVTGATYAQSASFRVEG